MLERTCLLLDTFSNCAHNIDLQIKISGAYSLLFDGIITGNVAVLLLADSEKSCHSYKLSTIVTQMKKNGINNSNL